MYTCVYMIKLITHVVYIYIYTNISKIGYVMLCYVMIYYLILYYIILYYTI